MGKKLLSVAIVMIALIMLIPGSSATDEGIICNGATIMTFSDSTTLDANSSTTVNLNIFNNNPGYITAEFIQSEGGPIRVSCDKGNTLIDGNTGEKALLTITSDKFASKGIYDVTLLIGIINSDGVKEQAELQLSVKLDSVYSPGDSYNMIMGIIPNTLPSPVNTPPVSMILSFFGWCLLGVLVTLFAFLCVRIVFIKLDGDPDLICRKIGKPVFLCTIIFGISNCLRVIGASEESIADVTMISGYLYLILGAYILWNIYMIVVQRILSKLEADGGINGVDTTLVPLFNVLGKIIIATIAVGAGLSMLGLDISAVMTGAGIVGLGLSLGAKATFNELFCGLILLFTRPFKAGDTVMIGNSKEAIVVKKVGIMFSEFSAGFTTEHFTMPNSSISNSMITNITATTREYRTLIYVNVPYGTNIELVKKLMKEAAYEHPNVIVDGSSDRPDVRLMSFGNSSISMRLAVYVKDYDVNGGTCGEIREKIVKKFRENDIIIPFQQKNISVFTDRSATDAS